jgi:hypothetical protein
VALSLNKKKEEKIQFAAPKKNSDESLTMTITTCL